MRSKMSPEELKAIISTGVQAFPLTDFDGSGDFSPAPYRLRIEWMSAHNPAALYIAGGAGEFFSLTPDEYSQVVSAAVEARNSKVPLIAAAGFGTRTAIAYALKAEELGADGILLLPPYLTETSQNGLFAHISEVCNAVNLPVIVYNRANCRLRAETLERLIAACPNLAGFKDGVGDMEEMIRIKSMVGSQIALINGMPTAEVYAGGYKGLGIRSYSSAVFSFWPEAASRFYHAIMGDDQDTVDTINRLFFSDYCRLRANQPGYAVSIAKAGARITGRSAGNVRPPLFDLTKDEEAELSQLISNLRSEIN